MRLLKGIMKGISRRDFCKQFVVCTFEHLYTIPHEAQVKQCYTVDSDTPL